MNCEQFQDDLALYVLGDLPADRASVLEEHLGECSLCQEELEDLRAVAAMVRGAIRSPAPAKRFDLLLKEIAANAFEQEKRQARRLSPRKMLVMGGRALATAAVLVLICAVAFALQTVAHEVDQAAAFGRSLVQDEPSPESNAVEVPAAPLQVASAQADDNHPSSLVRPDVNPLLSNSINVAFELNNVSAAPINREKKHMTQDKQLLFHAPLNSSLEAAFAAGDGRGRVVSEEAPKFDKDNGSPGAYFGGDTCVKYKVEGNFSREAGTVMLWFKPDWSFDMEDRLGRILWDLRIEHGSIVEDDPSQRYALVFVNPTGKNRPGPKPDNLERWRFCIATNRNRYTIGTEEKRADPRTRQAVFAQRIPFSAGDWLHLAATWTPEEGAIFVNGELSTREALLEGVPDKPLPEEMQLGAISSWMNAGACGVIADFRLYRGALSEEEIARIAEERP